MTLHTICLVDDNEHIVEIFSLLLAKDGFSVISASAGHTCIDILQTVTPDLILLDVMMEPMDGWETLERLKSNPRTRKIPVIMVSGKKPTADEIRIYGSLFEKYVMKPVSYSDLREEIMKVLISPVLPLN